MEPAEGKDLESFTAGDGSLFLGAQPGENQLLFWQTVHMSQFIAPGVPTLDSNTAEPSTYGLAH